VAPSRAVQPAARQLRREQRQETRQELRRERVQQAAPEQGRKAAQERRQQLQGRLREGNIGRAERRELHTLDRQERNAARQERRLQNAEQRFDRLQALQRDGRLNRSQQRDLQRLRNAPQLRERLQARDQRPQLSPDQRAERRAQRVTREQAQAGRFAAQSRNRFGERREARRALPLAARAAWQRGAFARYVPWRGAVYWPYAYTDVFYYTFWPRAYEPAYWAYAYDDFFDGVFFPDGAPYVEYAGGLYEGPYAAATTGSAPNRGTPGRITPAVRESCAEPDKGITAWPFRQIADAVRPNAEQEELLAQLERAAEEAAERLKQACPENLPMTPPGRLEAMTLRLRATLDAVKLVRPPLEKFYDSLTDEQKARFNEIGPEMARVGRSAAARQAEKQDDCAGAKAGLSTLAVDRIEDVVRPTDAQLAALDRLSGALDKAVDMLQAACPTTLALTPVGRLETMEQRLQAMIEAANMVRPALEHFYASLSNEQKARFNRLSRRTAQAQ
jgi:hypothetical protein